MKWFRKKNSNIKNKKNLNSYQKNNPILTKNPQKSYQKTPKMIPQF